MYNAIRQDADVGLFEARNCFAAFHASRKEGVDRPGELLELGIVFAGANVHGTRWRVASDFASSNGSVPVNDVLLRLVQHMRWADAIVAECLGGGDITNGEATRLYAHIAAVEHLWYARISGRPPEHAVWPALDVGAAQSLAARQADLFEDLVSTAHGAALARTVAYRNSAGRDFRNTVGDIVLQTTVHGEHHRGQIARLVRAAGGEPPYTDYIQFVRREQ